MSEHVDNAYAMLTAQVASDSLEGVAVLLHAIAESNLAVAYAQDTANLIAFNYSPRPHRDEAALALHGQITERLGLA